MKLFLISGRMRTGKGETAKAIIELLDLTEWNEYSFGYWVKQVALSMGWDGKKDDKGRNLLQFIGKTGRSYERDIWVNKTHKLIARNLSDYRPSALLKEDSSIVISDWRFGNESSFLKSTGKYDIIKVRIESPEREQKDSPYYNDESETSLPSGSEFPEYYDYIIWNTGTLNELKYKVRSMLVDLKLI